MSGPETVIFAQVNHFRHFRKKIGTYQVYLKSWYSDRNSRLFVRDLTEQPIQGNILDDDSDPNPSRVT